MFLRSFTQQVSTCPVEASRLLHWAPNKKYLTDWDYSISTFTVWGHPLVFSCERAVPFLRKPSLSEMTTIADFWQQKKIFFLAFLFVCCHCNNKHTLTSSFPVMVCEDTQPLTTGAVPFSASTVQPRTFVFMENARLFRKCLHDQSAATVEKWVCLDKCVCVCMRKGQGVSPYLVCIYLN